MCDGAMRYVGKTGDWWIRHEPKPIPDRRHDYDFWHDDYDGPEDNRCGTGASLMDVIEQIKEKEEDHV